MIKKQLHTIIHSIKMANEQLSSTDKVSERHKKNQEEENKRYSTELSKARLQDLNRRESEKKRKSNRDLDEGWFDGVALGGIPMLPKLLGPAIHGPTLVKNWNDFWYDTLFPGGTEAHEAEMEKLAQPIPVPEPPPEDNTEVDQTFPDWMGGGEWEEIEEQLTISELIPVGDKPQQVSDEQWKYQSGMVYDPTTDVVRKRRVQERLPIGHNPWYQRPVRDIFSTQILGRRDPNTNTLIEPSLPEIKQTIPGDMNGDGVTTPEEWWDWTGQIGQEETDFSEWEEIEP
tara:strand:+ start:885 stop:1742 length:858 start_codon:yes stop_codon:yes gene_type:complete